MLRAFRQSITIGPGGLVQVRSEELPEGTRAQVIVLVEDIESPHGANDAAARLVLLDQIQRHLALTPGSVAAWLAQVREERDTATDQILRKTQ